MANQTLLSQTASLEPGSAVAFPNTSRLRIVQFGPQVTIGFSGKVVIEGSNVASPGTNDWQALATVTFSSHATSLTLQIENNAIWLRARVITSTVGAIAVYADSSPGTITGTLGGAPASAVVDASVRVFGIGSTFKVNSAAVPAYTTDDVNLSTNLSITLTDYLMGLNGQVGIQNQITTLDNSLSAKFGNTGGAITGALTVIAGAVGAPAVKFTGALTTGLYRFGADGIAGAIAGTRAFSLDGSYAVVGDGATNGAPSMSVVSAVATPTYSFTGDLNSGMYRVSADKVGLAAGGVALATFDHSGAAGDIRVGSVVADNTKVQIDGVFAGEKILNAAAGTLVRAGAAGSIGDTALYTVPAGRTAVVTRIVAVLELSGATFSNATVASTPNPLRLNLGLSGGTKKELVDNVANVNVFYPLGYAYTTTGQVLVLDDLEGLAETAGATYKSLPAASAVVSNITVKASNAVEYDIRFFVFGFEY